MSSTEQCGKKGHVCPFQDYPVCDPAKPNEMWADLHRVMYFRHDDGSTDIKLVSADEEPNSKYDDLSEEGIGVLINGGMQKGGEFKAWDFAQKFFQDYEGICRSRVGKKFYAYRAHYSPAERLTYFNPLKIENSRMFEVEGFELAEDEAIALASSPELRLSLVDMVSLDAPDPDEAIQRGMYLFTNNSFRLARMIGILKSSVEIEISDERRSELITHLEGVYEKYEPKKDRMEAFLWLIGGSVLVSVFSLVYTIKHNAKRDRILEDSVTQSNKVAREHARIDGSDLKLKDIAIDQVEKLKAELEAKGVFEQPYIDSVDAKGVSVITRIIRSLFRQSADLNNRGHVGPSRSGKTASATRGLPQIALLAELEPAELEAYFEKVTQRMGKAEAAEYISRTRANIELFKQRLAQGGFVGFRSFSINITTFRSKGSVWYGKEDVVFEMMKQELLRLAEAGYKVDLFVDEVQQAEGTSGPKSEMTALRQKFKTMAELHANISVGYATTVDEAAESIAKDRATMERLDVIFHEARSPHEVIKILSAKPYILHQYGIETVDPLALKATYLLGIEAYTKDAPITSAGMFFEDVLSAVRDRGETFLSLEFVLEYYDTNHGLDGATNWLLAVEKIGDGVSQAELIDLLFDYEEAELREQNLHDRAKLKRTVEEGERPVRISKPYWEMTPQEILGLRRRGQGTPTPGVEGATTATDSKIQVELELVRRQLSDMPEFKQFFPSRITGQAGDYLALELKGYWEALSKADQMAFMGMEALDGAVVESGRLPKLFVLHAMAEIRGRIDGLKAPRTIGAIEKEQERRRGRGGYEADGAERRTEAARPEVKVDAPGAKTGK